MRFFDGKTLYCRVKAIDHSVDFGNIILSIFKEFFKNSKAYELMPLEVGEIFEGMYQLEERVQQSGDNQFVRWRADVISAFHRSEVLIDTYQHDYDPQLYWYGKIEGLSKIGQSTSASCRYFVWESDKPQSLVKIRMENLDELERSTVEELIDNLPITAQESILANEKPEIWRAGFGQFIIFYRKHEDGSVPFEQKQEIRKAWKQNQQVPDDEMTDPFLQPVGNTSAEVASSQGTKWFLIILVLGILSTLVLYQAIPPKPSSSHVSFQQSLDNGIAEEKRGAYDAAMEHFKVASSAPEDEEIDARLDSLAAIYLERARLECARYKAAGSAELYFIPNQYFNYAAVLSRQSKPEICQ